MVDVKLYCGDALEILPTLEAGSVDAIVCDPPYGCNNDCDYTRFSPSGSLGYVHDSNNHAPIHNDDIPFDPTPWLQFQNVILWGYQFFARALPVGTVLVWNKKRDSMLGTFLSDCELAWQKGGKGVYLFNHEWSGFMRASEKNDKTLHPTQKPVALMRWCIERISKPGDTIFDPYMGSGTTIVAAIQTGRNAIGIEIDPTYFAIAEKRIAEAQMQIRMEL
jgi:site-specific DNA-methyltransferase (adenine-specific)